MKRSLSNQNENKQKEKDENTLEKVYFASFFDHLIAGCVIYDVINEGKRSRDYIVKEINKAGLALERKTREQVIGRPISQIRPSVEKIGLVKIFESVWKTGKPVKIPPFIYKDKEFDNWYESTMFKLPGGEIAALYQDVTDVMTAHIEITERQEALNQYIQKAPFGIVVVNKAGKYIEANDAFCNLVEIKRDTLLSRSVRDEIEVLSISEVLRLFKQLITEKRLDVTISQQVDGNKKITLNIRGIKIAEDRYLVFVLDITEQSKLEAALKESSELLRLYFDKAPVCIFVFDGEGRILDTNEWAQRMFGFTKQAFMDMRINELTTELYRKKSSECLSALRKTGAVACEESTFLAKGEAVTMSINGARIDENRYIIFGADITEQRRLQKRLSESEAEYRALFDHAGTGIMYISPKGRIVWFNKEAARDLGGEPEDFAGKTLYEVFPKDIADIYQSRLKEVCESDGPTEYEDRMETPDGWRWFRTVHNCIYNADSEQLGIEIIFYDITDIKNSELKLVESEKKYRSLYEKAPTGFQSLDADGNILEVNGAWLKMLGYTRKEVMGKAIWNFLTPSTAVEFKKEFKTFIKRGSIDKRLEMINKSGETIIVQGAGIVTFDEHGEFIQTQCNLVDITEKERAEQKLVESELRYRTIFNQAAVGITSLAPDGRYLEVNDKFCDMTGYSRDELLTKRFLDITHPDDVEKSNQTFSEAMKKGEVAADLDKRYIRKDGTVLYAHLSSTIIKDTDTQQMRTVASISDLTIQKQIEQEKNRIEAQLREQQRLESIGILAGGVAHEINNPINGIMNYSQLILDVNNENQDIEDFANEIIRETNRVSYIVKNLLKFSRQETEGFADANVNEIVDQTLSLIRTLIRHDNIILNVNIPKTLKMIKCRSQQIQQVVMNLVTNARDALNAKYPKAHDNKILNITAKAIEEAEFSGIRIIVEDFGTGIPKNIQSRIFDPFFTTKGRDKGTGLGLAISHRIVTDHQGRFSLETQPGEYSRFYVDLPYAIK